MSAGSESATLDPGRSRAHCLAENTLCDLVQGALDRPALALAEGHLASCAGCRALVREVALSLSSGVVPTVVDGGDPPSPSSSLSPGTTVGRYEILFPVGSGAMGSVYAAHDPDLDRLVALKLLRAEASGEVLRVRLLREAKAMARLSHPSVIAVHDVGTHGTQLFIAMEFVAGGTLRRWIAERPRSWREVVAVYLQAARGLAGAHAAGLVHRDFKPDNVLVGEDGRVRITDFGLARVSRDDPAPAAPEASGTRDVLDATITRTGALIGTPAYMAPEQLRGAPADARSDMFGFCVALFEALYGQRPFEGTTLVQLRSASSAGRVLPATVGSRVPARLRRALLVGLRADPERRYDSMAALIHALEDASRARQSSTLAGVALAVAVSFGALALLRSPRIVEARAPSLRASALALPIERPELARSAGVAAPEPRAAPSGSSRAGEGEGGPAGESASATSTRRSAETPSHHALRPRSTAPPARSAAPASSSSAAPLAAPVKLGHNDSPILW